MGADLKRVRFWANLKGAYLCRADLEEATLSHAQLENADLHEANLKRAYLLNANLKGLDFNMAHLEEAKLYEANLQGAHLEQAHLEGADLDRAHLEGSNLQAAFFDIRTSLDKAFLGEEKFGFASLADVHWNGVNLAVVDWSPVSILGDEQWVRQPQFKRKVKQDKESFLDKYREAVRANRQLAVVLRDQGLNEEADHFAYRAQLLQRVVLRQRRRLLKYVLSWFLYLIAGYGYRPLRSLIIYLLLVVGFATSYYALTHMLHAQPYPLAWYEALILSVSSFHGRGFFQPVQNLGDPVAILASIEAVFGLLIEISFIATFTQRFFGK